MKKFVLISALTAVSIAVSGCGWLFGDKGVFRDRGDDYRRARVEKPLQIPPDLAQVEADQDFVIPETASNTVLEGKFEVPRPASIDGDPTAEQVRIRNLNGVNWILVEATPGEVWPRVRQFLNVNQLYVTRADAKDGIIETGWLQPKADGVSRERYRFRIEQGVQRGSSEIYILQAGAVAGDNWPVASSDAARESEMIKALAQFVADNGSTGAVSMLAQRGIDSRGKVFLNKPAGERPYLRVELPYERAWSSLTLALPKADFSIEDQNHDGREVLTRYTPPVDPEDEPGMWSRFWSWVFGDEDELANQKTIYVLSLRPTAENEVWIHLTRQDGKPISAAAEMELLNRIKNKLS
ncbi:MAG: outer membrane protein assembly factor BamC [Spongiibacteraceae bacterium]